MAVLVAHDGGRWLPEVLAALAAQTRPPAEVVCVDTGSTDGSSELMQAAYGRVVALPASTGYAAAVHAGLAAARRGADWVWLLHDDCAPDPEALAALLAGATRSPAAALLGPKVHDWYDPHLLVEVGLSTDGGGRRWTGLSGPEYDAGQHDGTREVLAVGTAGALVRRQVWDRLGGLDPDLPGFRDDLDLGWRVNAAGREVVVVPSASVRHARAATTGRRALDAVRGRPTAVDRRHALWVLAAHARAAHLPLLLARLLLASVLRALGRLLTRQPRAAYEEMSAYAAVALHPGRLRVARRRRAETRTRSRRDLRPLFFPATERLRSGLDALTDRWRGDGPEPSGAGRRLLRRPGVLLVLALALVALLSERSVLATGGGLLAGGRLLPPPGGARDLWAGYLAGWHEVGVGSGAPAAPALAVLAVLATVLLGKAWLAVDLVLLASVPLAGATAYAVTGSLVRHRALRLWAAATWALLPVATGAVAAGRLDVAAAQVALPALALTTGRLLVRDPRDTGYGAAVALGLGVALVAAFAPLLGVLVAAVLVVGGLAGLLLVARGLRGVARRRLLAACTAALVPAVVLLPWTTALVRQPGLLLHGFGRVAADADLADPLLPGWHLPLLAPGGAGLPPVWVTAGLLLAALGGTLRLARRSLALAAWTVGLGGLLVALVLVRTRIAPYAGARPVAVWPGPALQVAALGMLVAALVAADGLRTRLARQSFGPRQLLATSVAVLAAAVPVLAAGFWVVRGADDPLHRGVDRALPAFVEADLGSAPGRRALLLAQRDDGTVGYELRGAFPNRLGAAATPPAAAQVRGLDSVVADLVTGSGSDAGAALATRSVGWVTLAAGADSEQTASALDAQSGLTRRPAGDVLVWQVAAPAARLQVLPPGPASRARSGFRAPDGDSAPVALPSGREAAQAQVPAGATDRLLVLSEARDPGWRATLDGRRLPERTAWGWAQAFDLPASGGSLRLVYDSRPRRVALLVELALLVLLGVLAGPPPRRRRGLEPDRRGRPAPARGRRW